MNKLILRAYQSSDERKVIQLWQQCGLIVPWNNPQEDIKRKMADSPDMFIIGEIDDALVSTCMYGYDGHRGWVYYLAVKPELQRKRMASEMMKYVEDKLKSLGCPKINLMVRETNTSVKTFYYSIGYNDDPVVVLSRRLDKD